jgi:ATP-dependent Lhr-like helicase
LAQDTGLALARAAAALAPHWTVSVRTGDTASADKARQERRLPTALVTTPESLTLLQSRAEWRERFAHVQAVIVDEWHELMSSKRGVQVELALARLRTLQPALRVWGLSATLANLDEALACLVGPARAHAGRIVEGIAVKDIRIETARPATIERFPWGGHIGLKLLPQVIKAIESARSTLVFTNVRSATEIWYQKILEARPDWAGQIALHHGSLERDVRDWVEDGLRAHKLRAVVCTSSLDLGVDFAPVDQVLQIGSPKGVARLLQRAGRSGHQPGAVSKITVVPTQALELVEAAAAREAAEERRIEPRTALRGPLDALVQHLVTAALGGGFRAPELLREVRGTHAYQGLSEAEWQWALDFVIHGGASLNAYPEYRRVVMGDDGIAHVPDRQVRAPPSDPDRHDRLRLEHHPCRLRNGRKLGHVEESFIAMLSPGDAFVFAGRVLEFLARAGDDRVGAVGAPRKAAAITRWMGAKMPFSTLLAERTRRLIAQAKRGRYASPSSRSCVRSSCSKLAGRRCPTSANGCAKRIKLREGHHLFFYPFEGRLAHLGLATLFSYRLSRITPRSFSIMINDYGFGPAVGDARGARLHEIGQLLAAPGVERTSWPASMPPSSAAGSSARSRASPASCSRAIRGSRSPTGSCRPRAASYGTSSTNTIPATCSCARRRRKCWSASSRRRAWRARLRACAARVRSSPIPPGRRRSRSR